MPFLQDLLNIFKNPVLIVPAAAWLIAQVLKLIINAIVNKKLDFSRLVGDGGMPSGHSATVTALALMVGLSEGFNTPVFGLAMIFAIVVMHDASGVRREAGKQAVSIIQMAEMLNKHLFDEDEQLRTDTLKVFVGHTPLQVACGSGLGLIIGLVYYFWIGPALNVAPFYGM